MRLDLSNAAVADLKAIADYTFQHWGPEQEEEYIGGIWDLLERIAANPDGHRLRREFRSGCHSAKYQRHVIFFIVSPKKVEIVRILHGAMDFGTHLPEDFRL
jgi:toxin ParE1/3/4